MTWRATYQRVRCFLGWHGPDVEAMRHPRYPTLYLCKSCKEVIYAHDPRGTP